MNRNTKIWTVWVVSALIYLAMNTAALAVQSGVPGITTMIGWGIVMPLLLIMFWWILAALNRGDVKSWWLMGGLSTAIFAAAGIVTVKWIGDIWASI